MRHLLGIIAAVVIAAVLRHVFHVHLGLSREEIRAEALIAIVAIVGAMILTSLVRRWWRRPK
jgi:uncharacterized membrane protein YeaQ/YmgE (transglycosylase-associated protein family)